MGQSSLMKDIVIKANSKELKYTKKNVGNDTIRITVEIPSLSSKLNISTYVTIMLEITMDQMIQTMILTLEMITMLVAI